MLTILLCLCAVQGTFLDDPWGSFGPNFFSMKPKSAGAGGAKKSKAAQALEEFQAFEAAQAAQAAAQAAQAAQATQAAQPWKAPANRTYEGLEYENQGEWKEPFFFVQMADTQFGMLGGGQDGLNEEAAMADVAVEHINRLKPAFAIVCGDMTDTWAGSNPKQENAEVDMFKDVFSQVDESIPLLCLCGNHDIGNRPNSKTLNAYKSRWGDDYYSFWCGGVKFLVLNTQVYKALDESPQAQDLISMRKAQDAWLEKELEKTETENPAHLVVLSHIPPYIEAADEEDEYFNLKSTTRHELVNKCKAKGAKKWFCGHYHRNRVATDGEFEVVVTGAVGCNFETRKGVDRPARLGQMGMGQMLFAPDVSGFRIVKVGKDAIDHHFYSLSGMPANVDASAPEWEIPSQSVSNDVLKKFNFIDDDLYD